jgi:hypothetical protein
MFEAYVKVLDGQANITSGSDETFESLRVIE